MVTEFDGSLENLEGASRVVGHGSNADAVAPSGPETRGRNRPASARIGLSRVDEGMLGRQIGHSVRVAKRRLRPALISASPSRTTGLRSRKSGAAPFFMTSAMAALVSTSASVSRRPPTPGRPRPLAG